MLRLPPPAEAQARLIGLRMQAINIISIIISINPRGEFHSVHKCALQGGEGSDRGLHSQCYFHTSQRVSHPNPSPWKPGSVKLAGMSAMLGVNGGRRASTMALESGCSCKRKD